MWTSKLLLIPDVGTYLHKHLSSLLFWFSSAYYYVKQDQFFFIILKMIIIEAPFLNANALNTNKPTHYAYEWAR